MAEIDGLYPMNPREYPPAVLEAMEAKRYMQPYQPSMMPPHVSMLPQRYQVPPHMQSPQMGEGGMSNMSPEQVAQILKKQEMIEQFKQMITARRHAAMNP